MFIYTDSIELSSRLKKLGLSDDEIKQRSERSKIASKDDQRRPEFYKDIILNFSSIEVFYGIIERIIAKYDDTPNVDSNLISVMMSFNPENKKLIDYYDAMQSAVKLVSNKYKCVRLDETKGAKKISDEFKSLSQRSRCIIVDLTENKSSVYYELGTLHALGKECIITAEKGTDPDFYASEYRALFYDSSVDLRKKLVKELKRRVSGKAGI